MYNALISDCNSSISIMQGNAIRELVGMLGNDASIVIKFPFSSLRYQSAHEIKQISDFETHIPFPSEFNLSGHLNDLVILTSVSVA